jgi:hypothetical protein
MTTIKKGLVALVVAFISLGGALAFDSWEDLNSYNAQAWGDESDYLSLFTSTNNNLVIGDDEVWKTLNTDLFAVGANKVHLNSISKLTTVDGDRISTSQNSIDQIYYLPQDWTLTMSQDIALNGFPNNNAAGMSSQMSILDPVTNEPIVTFSSSMDQDEVDVIINQALADMGFAMTIDDFNAIEGNVKYSTDNTDSHGGITALYGQSKNLPVDMTQT